MRTKLLLFSVLLYSIILSCSAQSADKSLDRNLSKIYKESNFPGFAIAIIKDDSVLFSKGYGFADKNLKVPYTIETIQPVASVSKTFVALALMKCIELGYFNLETNINDVLPFKITNPNFPNDIVKIKHLATHTSSLIDNDTTRFKSYSLGTKPIMGLDSFLKDYYVPNGKFYSLQNFGKNRAGLEYSYSNIATTLMAYIIEFKSKMSFNDFTSKYIFEPLKMSHTSWYYNENYKSQYATLYQIVKPENPLYYKLMNVDNSLKTYCTVTYPDGSLYTSIKDLSNYMKIMMKGYFTDQTEIINKTSYQTLFRKQFSEKDMPLNMDTKEPNRGIFWSYSKKGAIRHTGSSAGVFAFLSINPVTKVGRIMMLNGGLDGEDNIQTVGYFLKVIAALDSFEETLK